MLSIVKFYGSGGRRTLPRDGYSTVINFEDVGRSARFKLQAGEYKWDCWLPMRVDLLIEESMKPHTRFQIMEGARQVGEGLTW